MLASKAEGMPPGGKVCPIQLAMRIQSGMNCSGGLRPPNRRSEIDATEEKFAVDPA